jgi:hypothetical protein
VGWNDPESLFGRASGEKGGSFQPTSVFCVRPNFATPRVQLVLLARVARITEVNAKVNAPVNGMFRVAFTFQRAENPHKMRRSSTLAEGKICYRGAISSLLTGNLCRGGVKAGRDPENPREP